MLELYFVFYRIPKMMTQLARERNRSAVAWSIFGILAWIGAEFFVMVFFGFGYGLLALVNGWTADIPPVLTIVMYVVALGSAIGAFLIVRKILSSRPIGPDGPIPPPPPQFSS